MDRAIIYPVICYVYLLSNMFTYNIVIPFPSYNFPLIVFTCVSPFMFKNVWCAALIPTYEACEVYFSKEPIITMTWTSMSYLRLCGAEMCFWWWNIVFWMMKHSAFEDAIYKWWMHLISSDLYCIIAKWIKLWQNWSMCCAVLFFAISCTLAAHLHYLLSLHLQSNILCLRATLRLLVLVKYVIPWF